MTTDEMIAVLNVIKAGSKPVEKSARGASNWAPFNPARDEFDPAVYDYRVKPEPREVWLPCRKDGVPTAGIVLLEAPRPGSDGIWCHFVEVEP